MLAPGTLLDGRFEIQAAVAAGGMGRVYRAHDRVTAATIAIKVLVGHGGAEAERFAREAEILGRLEHPHIVRYIAHGLTAEGEPWIAMEWLDGETLESRLAREGLSPDEALQAIQRVALALGEIHRRGLVHRDVKPANVILPAGDLARITLIDFGIARGRDEIAHLTRTGTAVGTLGYMAPEQARGDRRVDARVDVFALGCVLFACLTGQPPFHGPSPLVVQSRILFDEPPPLAALLPEAPEPLEALLRRMLAKPRDLRPADGAAVAAELAAIGPIGSTRRRAASDRGARAELPTTPGPPPVTTQPTAPPAPGSALQSVVVASVLGGAPVSDAATVELDDLAGRQDALRRGLEPLHAQVEILADGTVMALIAGSASREEHGARAAGCALAMRALMDTPIALLTSEGAGSGSGPLSDLLERGARAAALQGARARRQAAGGGDAIVIDDLTAALLGDRFEVRRDKRGAYLIGKRR